MNAVTLAADRRRVDDGGRAADHALPLQLVQPVRDCRTRQADLLGDLGRGRPRVLQEQVDDSKVKLIQFDGHMNNMAPNRRFGKWYTYESSE